MRRWASHAGIKMCPGCEKGLTKSIRVDKSASSCQTTDFRVNQGFKEFLSPPGLYSDPTLKVNILLTSEYSDAGHVCSVCWIQGTYLVCKYSPFGPHCSLAEFTKGSEWKVLFWSQCCKIMNSFRCFLCSPLRTIPWLTCPVNGNNAFLVILKAIFPIEGTALIIYEMEFRLKWILTCPHETTSDLNLVQVFNVETILSWINLFQTPEQIFPLGDNLCAPSLESCTNLSYL